MQLTAKSGFTVYSIHIDKDCCLSSDNLVTFYFIAREPRIFFGEFAKVYIKARSLVLDIFDRWRSSYMTDFYCSKYSCLVFSI